MKEKFGASDGFSFSFHDLHIPSDEFAQFATGFGTKAFAFS